MKNRILPLLVIVALIAVQLPAFLAFPAMAAEETVENDTPLFSIMDYGGIEYMWSAGDYYQSDDWSFTIYEWTTVDFSLPQSLVVKYIDVLFYCSTPLISVADDSTDFTVLRLASDIYRISGSYFKDDSSIADYISLSFDTTNPYGAEISILSFEVALTATFSSSLAFNATIKSGSTTSSILYPNTSSATMTAGGSNYRISVDFSVDSYYKGYDYLDLIFVTNCNDIGSISANGASSNIPVYLSYIDTEGYTNSPYSWVTIRIDLSSVDRSTLELYLQIDGVCVSGTSYYFAFADCVALLTYDLPSSDAYWSSEIVNRLDLSVSWLTSVADLLRAGNDELSYISYMVGLIVDALSSDGSGEAAKVESEEKSQQVSDMVDQMDAMEKPDAAAVGSSGSVSSIVDTDTLSGSTGFLTAVVTAPYINQVVILSLTLALAAYIFFGKRG